MIDRHYGHLARDGREHAAALLDSLAADEPQPPRGRSVDVAAWQQEGRQEARISAPVE